MVNEEVAVETAGCEGDQEEVLWEQGVLWEHEGDLEERGDGAEKHATRRRREKEREEVGG